MIPLKGASRLVHLDFLGFLEINVKCWSIFFGMLFPQDAIFTDQYDMTNSWSKILEQNLQAGKASKNIPLKTWHIGSVIALCP